MPKKDVKHRTKMQMRSPKKRAQDFDETALGYTEEEAVKEANRCLGCKNPPCVEACPCKTDIKTYINQIAEGRYEEALETIMEDNPLPGSCGRVCPHPCEEACLLKKIGDPIAIAWLKRFVADTSLEVFEERKAEKSTGKRVAIIGSGPAGLTVASYLAKKGHDITVFEELLIAGGMLAVGIPEYRLPKAVLELEIRKIKDLGVDLRLNTPIDDLDSLFEQGFDRVFIGIGAHKPKWMNIPGEDLDGVIHAISFLKEVNLGKKVELGKKVAVIGGGNVAMDAVRSAKRLGSESFILYRRGREQAPADPFEIEEAEEEGIKLNFLTNPTKIIGKEGKVTGLECLRMKLGEPDSSGRKRPVPIEGTEYFVEADNVIEAISQEPIVAWLENSGLSINRWNCIDVDEKGETYQTDKARVYSAGDVVTGPKTVIEAIATARKAAEAIDKSLTEEDS